MKCNVLMLHGYKGTWNNGWFSTVQLKLERLNIPYISPNLPNPENPDYHQWKKTILKIINEKFLSQENNDSILIVAHSLACFAILRLIDELLFTNDENTNALFIINKIKCLFLVAPIVSFHSKFPHFTDYHFSYSKQSNLIDKSLIYPIKTYLIYSIDDNYVDKDVIQRFISNFANARQDPKERSSLLNIFYVEKQGYMHYMQDDVPFISDLIIDNCLK